MPKDDREIKSAVRVHADRETGAGRATFEPGMEDELAAAVDQPTLDKLVQSGTLAGTWKTSKKAEPEKAKK